MNYLRLSDLTQTIEEMFSISFSGKYFWIIAEVANLSHVGSRNWYFFDLIEKEEKGNGLKAKISTTAFTTGVQKIRDFEAQTLQSFESGLEVLVKVEVKYHPEYGLKLDLKDISPDFTLGKLEAQRRKTLQLLLERNPEHIRLENEKIITFNQELSLPPVIQRIAIIASPSSAGYGDFLHTLNNNAAGFSFKTDLFPTEVQGQGNAQIMVDRLVQIYESERDYDAVVIIRGGGATTDLLLFDQYPIARAIARFPIPVITGIGHQRDNTLADQVSHTSLKTPTMVADFILETNVGFFNQVIRLQDAILHATRYRIADHQREFSFLQSSLQTGARERLGSEQVTLQELLYGLYRKPSQLVNGHHLHLQGFTRDFYEITSRRLLLQKNEIEKFEKIVALADPEATLRRGFALVKQDGKFLKHNSEVFSGSVINVYLSKIRINATVDDIEPGTGESNL